LKYFAEARNWTASCASLGPGWPAAHLSALRRFLARAFDCELMMDRLGSGATSGAAMTGNDKN
jgi:hypothetical protein